jgi:hypothetical protein
MILTTIAWAGLISAAIPTLMFLKNRKLFLPPRDQMRLLAPQHAATARATSAPDAVPQEASARSNVSVLIPARDEAAGIADAIASALASNEVVVEVVVLDDNSTDRTAEIVREIAQKDDRVKLISGQSLPQGWNGKQFACYQLAKQASYERLVFIDADVRLQPNALADLVAYQNASGAALLSAFPHQVTGTWLEKWLIPMMHFILLGFLPIDRMRLSRQKAYASGCGQLFMTRRSDYQKAGTHESIRGSRHDGLKLPAAYRKADMSTDIVDGTPLASCRMYRSAGQVLRGLAKNASEGIASPALIIPFSSILLGGTALPWIGLVGSILTGQTTALTISIIALLVSHVPRAIAVRQFRQSWFGALCHTPAVVTFVAIQWFALVNHMLGRQVAWRGRI